MESPTNSEILWGKIRFAENRLFSATHIFWNHPHLDRLFPAFLIQTHCLVRSGLALMEAARDRALALPGDAVARDLAAYLHTHLEEERGHDLWLLDDIRSLGIAENEVFHAQPCPALVNLVGAQYFWMSHIHPVAVMGYLILLEGYAPVVSQLEDIRRRTALPASAFRCLKHHAEDDPAHLADLNSTLDRMVLSADQARAVAMSAFAVIDGVASLFEELQENCAAGTDPRKELEYARA